MLTETAVTEEGCRIFCFVIRLRGILDQVKNAIPPGRVMTNIRNMVVLVLNVGSVRSTHVVTDGVDPPNRSVPVLVPPSYAAWHRILDDVVYQWSTVVHAQTKSRVENQPIECP